MSGFEWHPLVKMTPDNGAAVTFDLRALLTDASGPVRHDVRYQDEGDTVTDVNHASRRINQGIGVDVTLTFDIATMADHATLATVVDRLIRNDWTVALSLDNGTTYRDAVLTRMPSPRPFRGKTVGGATFELGLRCVDLLDELPAMTEGVTPW